MRNVYHIDPRAARSYSWIDDNEVSEVEPSCDWFYLDDAWFATNQKTHSATKGLTS